MTDRIAEYLDNAHVFYLATCDGGQPRVRPFGFSMSYDGRLWFSTVAGKDVYYQLQRSPLVEICALGSDGTWLRVSGEAVFDNSEQVQNARLARRKKHATGPDLKKVYKEKEPDFCMFYLKNGEARLYAAGKGTVERWQF